MEARLGHVSHIPGLCSALRETFFKFLYFAVIRVLHLSVLACPSTRHLLIRRTEAYRRANPPHYHSISPQPLLRSSRNQVLCVPWVKIYLENIFPTQSECSFLHFQCTIQWFYPKKKSSGCQNFEPLYLRNRWSDCDELYVVATGRTSCIFSTWSPHSIHTCTCYNCPAKLCPPLCHLCPPLCHLRPPLGPGGTMGVPCPCLWSSGRS